jgi:hypothetical protein
MHKLGFTLLALSILTCGSLRAQTRGTISGFTKDPAGAFVPGVKLTIANERTGATRSVTSDQTGFYQVIGLVSGVYTVEAESPGFRRFRNTGVVLQVDENVRADVLLELGDVQQTVEVTAMAAQVDTRSSESSAVIDDRRIVDLPLGNRNVFGLAKTLPGVLGVSAPDNSRIADARSGPQMNVHGGRANMNYNQFNGAYFMNPSRNTGLNPPPPDAIQEFKIQTSNFSADSGRNPGSNITIVSRQGTNQIHGSIWEFHRNDNLNARSFFQETKPELKKNQYGAAAGGPIQRNRAFVFGTAEFNKDRDQPTVVNSLPPSGPELSGDFSHLTAKTLRNPFDGTPFPNNQIPTSMFDPAARRILEFVPTVPNLGGTYQGFGRRPRDSELYMIRSDFLMTDNQSLFGTYYYNQNSDLQEGAGAFGSTFPDWTAVDRRTRVQTASLNHTYMISPSTLNQTTVGYTRSFSLNAPTITRLPEELGVQGMPMYTDGGSLRFSVAGRWTLGSGGIVKFASNTYQIKNSTSVIRGRHTFKFGGEYMDIGWFQSFLGPPQFTFTGIRTGRGAASAGDAMADFLLGAYDSLPISAGVRNNDDHTKFLVFFAQDDFKATQRLTLNLGLRWELPWPWVEKFDRLNAVYMDPSIQSTLVPQAPPGMLFPGDRLPSGGTMPRGLVNMDKNNLAPRIGFAYDLFGDGRTALRGAYGMFYETANGDTLAQTNPPFVVGSETFRDGLLSNPFGSIGAAPLPITIPPTGVQFTYPLNGLWGPLNTDLSTTVVHNWSFNIDRELVRDYALSLGYVGKRGNNLLAFRPYNAAIFVPGVGTNGTPLSTRANINARVPFLPGIYGPSGLYLDNFARSNYNGMVLQLRKRFSQGFQFDTSYVLSKSLDSSSTTTLGGCLTDPYNPNHDYGRSSWDRRHAYVFSGMWNPQFYRGSQGAVSRILGGWSLSSITTVQSGAPLTFSSGQDTQLNGTGCNSRANIVGDPQRSHSSRNDMITNFFNTAAFAQPPDGSVGTSGRGILNGPADVSTDLAILKDIRVTEATRFQFRAELLNAFNQVNFGNPITTLNNARFGQITSAADGRMIQLGLKFLW